MLGTRRQAAAGFTSTFCVILLLAFYQRQVRLPTSARIQIQAPPSIRGRVRSAASVRAEYRWRRCRRVLQMSQVRFFWERAEDGRQDRQEDNRHGQEDGQQDRWQEETWREDSRRKNMWPNTGDRQRCLQRLRTPQDLYLDLRKLSELQGRQARLVFLGDSRIRVLQEAISDELDMQPDEPWPNMTLHYDPYMFTEQHLQRAAPSLESLDYENLLPGCFEAHILSTFPLVQCSLLAVDTHLRSEFWWRPYPDGRFAERLDWLLEECDAGRCPDITVLDGGAWPGTVYRQTEGLRAAMRVVSFAEDLARLQPKLKRLASVTRLLWKVDEPYTPDASLGYKSNKTGAMMVTTAAVYQMAQKIPGLTLWSTAISEWLQFYHDVCLPNKDKLWDNMYEELNYQCLDPMHMGSVVQWRMLLTLFDVLLQDVAKPTEDFCCSM